MIRFQSPLPKNYDQIVDIFMRQDDEQPVVTALGQSIMKLPTAPVLSCISTPSLYPIQEEKEEAKSMVRVTFPGPDEMKPSAVKSYRRPTSGGFSLATDPFVAKPPVVAAQDPTQLKEANPALTDEYLKQREDLKAQRDAAAVVTEKEQKVVEQSVDIPADFIETQRRQFDEQQAALRLARAHAATPDSKLEKEQELELPPPNATPVIKSKAVLSLITPSEKKAHADVEQALPAPQVMRQIESLNLMELRQLCIRNGQSSKGNKPDLVTRLKAVGITASV